MDSKLWIIIFASRYCCWNNACIAFDSTSSRNIFIADIFNAFRAHFDLQLVDLLTLVLSLKAIYKIGISIRFNCWPGREIRSLFKFSWNSHICHVNYFKRNNYGPNFNMHCAYERLHSDSSWMAVQSSLAWGLFVALSFSTLGFLGWTHYYAAWCVPIRIHFEFYLNVRQTGNKIGPISEGF